ncbi:MAG: lipoprotein [Pseudomonadota bacterium]|nr:lipoprotein [Pseudomonadota bacterium]
MKQILIALLIVLAACVLSACGNKGPLVAVQRPVPLEDATPAVESPPPTDPADPAPVEEIAPPVDEKPASSKPA